MSAVLRVLRIAVVLAAGVGAWFGYDQFAAADDPDALTDVSEIEAAAASTAPWSGLGIVVAETTWDGPTATSLQPFGEPVRQSMTFDPESGRTQMSLFDPLGDAAGFVEIDANEVFVKEPGGVWETPKPDAVLSESALRTGASFGRPPTLLDLVPEVVWPYTVILSDVAGPDPALPTRILTIRIKGGAFAAAQPALAAQWRNTAYYPDQSGRVEIEVEIDADGHVVGVRNMAPDDNVQVRFLPAPRPPEFEAPFVD